MYSSVTVCPESNTVLYKITQNAQLSSNKQAVGKQLQT